MQEGRPGGRRPPLEVRAPRHLPDEGVAPHLGILPGPTYPRIQQVLVHGQELLHRVPANKERGEVVIFILQASDFGLLAIYAIRLGLQSPEEHLGLLCFPPEVDVDEVVSPAGAAVLGRPAHDQPAGGGQLGPLTWSAAPGRRRAAAGGSAQNCCAAYHRLLSESPVSAGIELLLSFFLLLAFSTG